MNFWLSFILYNPVEAFMLLTCCYLFTNNNNKEKFDIKKYIKHSFIMGSLIFLPLQYPMTNIDSQITFMIYNIFICNIILPLIFFVYVNLFVIRINFFRAILIITLYLITLILLLTNLDFSLLANNSLQKEFIMNVSTKSMQLMIIFIMIGVGKMKQFLIKLASSSMGKSIASTMYGALEPEVSEELKNEITK